MAITLVGTAEGSNTNGNNVTITLPTVLTGDVVYLAGGHARASADAGASTSGYTELSDTPFTGAADECRFAVSRKVMGATPDTEVVGLGSGNAADAAAYVVIALRGVDTTTPEDATSTRAEGESTNPDPPSIDTATAGAWVLPFAGSSKLDIAITAPSGYSNQVDIDGNDNNDFTAAGATKEIASPSTENPGTWTNWASGAWIAVTVAVRPAATGQPTMRRWGGVPGMLGAGRPGSGRSWCTVPDLSWLKDLIQPARPAWLNGSRSCRTISRRRRQAQTV